MICFCKLDGRDGVKLCPNAIRHSVERAKNMKDVKGGYNCADRTKTYPGTGGSSWRGLGLPGRGSP